MGLSCAVSQPALIDIDTRVPYRPGRPNRVQFSSLGRRNRSRSCGTADLKHVVDQVRLALPKLAVQVIFGEGLEEPPVRNNHVVPTIPPPAAQSRERDVR